MEENKLIFLWTSSHKQKKHVVDFIHENLGFFTNDGEIIKESLLKFAGLSKEELKNK